MSTRFTSGNSFGVPSGYEGESPDFEIPSCGIEDVDRAFFECFEKEVCLEVEADIGKSQKVPTIFAAGERWSMLKNGRAIRDENGTLILPLLTIRRTGIEQDSSADIAGRGMNQQTGNFTITRKLDYKDRKYQNIINKLGLENQKNLGVKRSDDPEQLLTDRETGEHSRDLDIINGGLLAPKIDKNIYQIITLPSPQFFTATYEITIWAQYAVHMNQMLEKLMSSYLPTGQRTLKLNTPKGYWFIAYFDSGYQSEDNVEEYTSSELIRKCKFQIKVPAYLISSSAPGVPKGARSHISAPVISFAIAGEEVDTELVNGVPGASDPYFGADDPDLYLLSRQDNSILNRAEVKRIQRVQKNPFTGKNESEFVRVVRQNPKSGETVLIPESGGFKLKIS